MSENDFIRWLDRWTPAPEEGRLRDFKAMLMMLARLIQRMVQSNLADWEARRNEEAVTRIAASLSPGLALWDVLCRVLEAVYNLIPFHYGDFLIVDGDQGELVILAHKLGEERAKPATRSISPLGLPLGVGITGWVAQNGQTARVPDIRLDERYVPCYEKTLSELAVPLVHENCILGVLNLESEEQGSFTERDERLLGALAGRIAPAVARAREHDALRRQEREWQGRVAALGELYRTIVESRSPTVLLQELARGIVNLCPDYHRCTIWQYDPEKEVLHRMSVGHKTQVSHPADEDAVRMPFGDSISGTAIRRGQPVGVHDLARHPSFYLKELAAELGLQAMLSVPLPGPLGCDTPLGCINVFTTSRRRKFSSKDKRLLEHIAKFACVALANLQTSLVMAAYQETAHLCRHDLRSRGALNRVARLVCKKTGARGCSVFLREGDTLRLKGTTGLQGVSDYDAVTYQLGEGMTGWVAKYERSLRIIDQYTPDELAYYGEDLKPQYKYREDIPSLPDHLRRGFLAVPIRANGDVLGVIRAVGKERNLPFTPLDQTILEAIASQFGAVLSAARAAEEKEAKLDRYHRQLLQLFELTSQILDPSDGDQMLRNVVKLAREAVKADTGSIALYNPADCMLYVRIFEPRQWEPEARKHPIPARSGESVIGEVYTADTPQNCPDVNAAGSAAKPVHPDTQALLAVPLTGAGERLGVLALGSFRLHYFNDHDCELLQCFARVAAAFIVVGRLLKEKDEFMATLAHQLGAPIAALNSHCYDILGGVPMTEERRIRILQTVSACCQLASNVASNFSAVQKILSRPDFPLETDRVELSRLVKWAADLYQPLAHSRELQIAVDLGNPEVLVPIEANENLLQQVLINLLDNAVKYSLKKTEIRVSLKREDGASCTVCIHNIGIPIAEGERERIFERGYRSRTAAQWVPVGTGIGLLVARSIARRHGGDIWVESIANRDRSPAADVRFYMRLPLARQ